MAKDCNDCSFHFGTLKKYCYLRNQSWANIKSGPGGSLQPDDAPILESLLETEPFCEGNCDMCKFGTLTSREDKYYVCAPFICTRHLCYEIAEYKQHEEE